MFMVVLLSFFVAFVASVIATLRRDPGGSRRSRRRLPRKRARTPTSPLHRGIVLWSSGDLACSAFCHNFVSALSVYYHGPLITLHYGQNNDGRLKDDAWLGIFVVSSCEALAIAMNNSQGEGCSHGILLDATEPAEAALISLWQVKIQSLGIVEVHPPMRCGLLATPHRMDLFCRQICLHLGVESRMLKSEPSLEFVDIDLASPMNETSSSDKNLSGRSQAP